MYVFGKPNTYKTFVQVYRVVHMVVEKLLLTMGEELRFRM